MLVRLDHANNILIQIGGSPSVVRRGQSVDLTQEEWDALDEDQQGLFERVGGSAAGTVLTVIEDSGVAQVLDCAGGQAAFDVTETDDCAYTLGGAVAGVECSVTLLRRSGGFTPTLPDALWSNALPIPASLAEGKIDVFCFVTYDGETWIASAFATNVSAPSEAPPPPPPPPALSIIDAFTRSDGPIGVTDTGEDWVEWGSSWSVLGNKAVCSALVAGNSGFLLVNAGTADAMPSVDITMEAAKFPSLVARFTDDANYIVLQAVAGVLRLYRIVAGAATELDAASAGLVHADGETHRWSISCNGNAIQTFLDDVLIHDAVEAFNNTQENFGLRAYDGPLTTGRFDNFEITEPA